MLYTTTRNNQETFTAQRVLISKRAPDGGLFVPFRLPVYSAEEISRLSSMSFHARLAEILNLMFSARLTGYDIDLAVGKRAVRMRQLGQRLFVAECWHNTQWQFSELLNGLSGLILSDSDAAPEVTGWLETGIRMAVLFGAVGELIREGVVSAEKPVDVSMVSGNFSGPMAAWYARGMGFPIGNIVCCCNENSALWDFICHGQLRTDGIALRTHVPEADILIPEGLERLIALYGGAEEVERYVDCLRAGKTYYMDDGLLGRLRKGLYVTVSSEQRILSTVSSSFSAHQCVLSLSAALAYAGLQDYRARTGTSRVALIMADRSPGLDLPLMEEIIGYPEKDLEKYY